ncbi:rod shape-determining protein MreC [Sphingomonas lacunae]|uniref:Cell shape-determining protein MreC n=1 Tax=Sphingomonas lacunae TaxID=2698828 RepID=A0A6M4AV17_9SPHN|nr:rod shape-determining protein MreC [Sphingomonas lacunae]QJQ32933.1 rod shape-determining protein MreC [Sphingomonas lacunae]
MASSSSGRRAYDRRAQYGAFAAYVVAITGVIAGLLSAIIWMVDPVGFSNLRMVVAEATAPVGRVINAGTSSVSAVDDNIAAWWNAGSQNRQLRQELTAARRELIRARGLEAENRQLQQLLGLTRGDVRPVAIGRLLSTSATSTHRYAILDAGFADGVRTGQPVRAAAGLIGRTLEVGPSVSRIQLITDRKNVVPARRGRDGLAVVVSGRGDDLLEVRPLNAAGNPLKVGDVLLASGVGGLYQPRTPVALVVQLTHDGALARPMADPWRADAVIVEPASAANLDEPPPPTEQSPEAGNGGGATP